MNGSLESACAFAESFLSQLSVAEPCVHQIGLAPPFPFMSSLRQALDALNGKSDSSQKGVWVGGQNCHAIPDKGAFTGEISARMLVNVGADFVILGHSERRAAGESSGDVCQKVQAAWQERLPTIVCVGETLRERESGLAVGVVQGQIRHSLPVPQENMPLVWLAYEPVWAIGTGIQPTQTQLAEMMHVCRDTLHACGHDAPVLYGGSVKPDNIGPIMQAAGAEGVLVGGASLDAKEFFELIRNCP